MWDGLERTGWRHRWSYDGLRRRSFFDGRSLRCWCILVIRLRFRQTQNRHQYVRGADQRPFAVCPNGRIEAIDGRILASQKFSSQIGCRRHTLQIPVTICNERLCITRYMVNAFVSSWICPMDQRLHLHWFIRCNECGYVQCINYATHIGRDDQPRHLERCITRLCRKGKITRPNG